MMKRLFVKLCLISSLFLVNTNASSELKSRDDPVLVTVNGVDITQSEVQNFIVKQSKSISIQAALKEMINVELLNQAARDENLLRDKTLQMEIKRNQSALVASYYLKKYLRNLEITEPMLNERYRNQYLDEKQATEYNANHILLKTELEAEDVIKQLNAGADFATLAKTLSVGPSSKEGGALGWFKQGDMVEPFSKATMSLKPDSYSKTPIQTRFGWHVIYLNDIRTVTPPTFDFVRDKLTTEIAGESIRQKVKSLQDKAFIDYRR